MNLYTATINPSGATKIVDRGAQVRLNGTVLRFHEDDDRSAHIFYRRYMRNLVGVLFSDSDYSIYAEPKIEQSATPLGLRANPNTREIARPGLAGGHRRTTD